ncbi:unnamed protein product, partial [Candidula unifasciata]
FPKSNINAILEKLAVRLGSNKEDVRAFFAKTDPAGSGYMSYEKFREMALSIEPTLTEHEIITVARQFSDRRSDIVLDVDKLTSIIQEELRKKNFEGFGTLISSLRHLDKDCTGFLSRDDIRREFIAQHVPISDDMLRAALSVAKTSENNNEAILYEDFVNSFNWRDFPAPPAQYQSAVGDEEWCRSKPQSKIEQVHYQSLLQRLFSNAKDNI